MLAPLRFEQEVCHCCLQSCPLQTTSQSLPEDERPQGQWDFFLVPFLLEFEPMESLRGLFNDLEMLGLKIPAGDVGVFDRELFGLLVWMLRLRRLLLVAEGLLIELLTIDK